MLLSERLASCQWLCLHRLPCQYPFMQTASPWFSYQWFAGVCLGACGDINRSAGANDGLGCRMAGVKEATLRQCRSSPQMIAQHLFRSANRVFYFGWTYRDVRRSLPLDECGSDQQLLRHAWRGCQYVQWHRSTRVTTTFAGHNPRSMLRTRRWAACPACGLGRPTESLIDWRLKRWQPGLTVAGHLRPDRLGSVGHQQRRCATLSTDERGASLAAACPLEWMLGLWIACLVCVRELDSGLVYMEEATPQSSIASTLRER